MANFTASKTIGSAGATFSTYQLWEDGINNQLTTAEKSSATTFLVAAFTQGENLTFTAGATGRLVDTDSTGAGTGTYVAYTITSGNPTIGDVVTGGTSGATCVLSSSTADNVGVIWKGMPNAVEELTVNGNALTIGGATASSTAYKWLAGIASGFSFVTNANVRTNALRYNTANGAALRSTSLSGVGLTILETNTHIDGMQIAASSSGANSIALDITSSATGVVIDSNILDGGTSSTFGVMRLNNNTTAATLANNLLCLRKTGATAIVQLTNNTNTLTSINNTYAASDDLAAAPTEIFLIGAAATVNSTNDAMFAGDSTKAIVGGTGTANFTNGYSDISGTTGVTQITYDTSLFVNITDATRDFREASTSGMAQIGTIDSTNAPDDISQFTRTTLADIGCWQLAAATSSIVPILDSYRSRRMA